MACSTLAWADDPNPYYIGVTAGITHDSNVNRAAGGKADTYGSTGLVGGVDQMIGRQHVYANANVSLNRYRDQTQFDNTSYGATAGLDWQTIGRLSGSVYGRVSQGLAGLNNNLVQTTEGRNLVRTESLGTRFNWGANAEISLQGGYGYSKSNYSDPTLQASSSNQSSADIGVYYQPGVTLTLGTALRYTWSDSDRAFQAADGSFLSNRTSGRNIDLSANWHPTVQSGVNARISFTNQSNSASGGEGFSGLTGALGFSYAPTAKLSFNGQISRDASTNGSFYNTFDGTTNQSSVGLAESDSVSNGVNLGATYAATSKISVNAGIGYRRTTQTSTVGSSSGYHDSLTSESLGANWGITRYWSLGCSLSHVNRDITAALINGANGGYGATAIGCTTQVTLR